mmetsp:Transcript_10539/g.22656  ORF Transcript_10539/g.22656 Transcript_10539/m.22656 type:complete len:80 (-) Transcript_10539:159-398(-)
MKGLLLEPQVEGGPTVILSVYFQPFGNLVWPAWLEICVSRIFRAADSQFKLNCGFGIARLPWLTLENAPASKKHSSNRC